MQDQDRRPLGRSDLGPLLACIVAGLIVALWPHLVWWRSLGEPTWISDNDDLLYLSVAGRSYFEHPARLSDPARPQGGPTLYPWSQFAPAVLTAHGLGLGPANILLVWRAWAGASLALAFYGIVRLATPTPRVAAALTFLMLLDCGFLDSRPIVQQARVAARVLLGQTGGLFATKPLIFNQYRIITPGLSLYALALFVWLLLRARAAPTRERVTLAGLGLGMLFYVYFYYWTAAGLALALLWAIDVGHRSVAWRAAAIGAVVGLPEVVRSALVRQGAADGWPMRVNLFLPISRTGELLVHKEALLALALTFAWCWTRERRWLPLWTVAASGWLLSNHALLTGLQIQNDHWSYVRAPCLTWLMVVLALVPLVERALATRRGTAAVLALLAAFGAVGLGLRHLEATRTTETVAIQNRWKAYRAQRAGAERLAPNAVIAGDPAFVNCAAIAEDQRPLNHYSVLVSPSISDAEWDARVALNAFLLGADRATFAAEQTQWADRTAWGPWARDPNRQAERLASRLAAYDRAARGPEAALDRFSVRYLALPTGHAPSSGRGSGWALRQQGPSWGLWERLKPRTQGHRLPRDWEGSSPKSRR